MESLLLAIYGGFAALTTLLTVLGLRHEARRTGDASRAVAEAAGLSEVEVSRYRPLDVSGRLRARSGPVEVELITGFFASQKGQRSVITLSGLADLSLDTEGVSTSLSRSLGGLEVHVGDPPFDDTLFVRGAEPLVRSVLDAETRRLVLLLFDGRVEVPDRDTTRALESVVSLKSGVLRVEAVNVIASPKWLGEVLLSLLDVARRLARPADIPGRLAMNAGADPLPAVRRANLRVLAAQYAGLPATHRALRSALEDPDPEVGLVAALELGEEGWPVLRRIASGARVSEKIQASALRALGKLLPIADGLEVLSQALRTRRLPVAEACLAALGDRGGADVVDPLAKVLAVERGRLAVVAARALGATGEVASEPSLVAALGRTDEGVGVAVAEALGLVGTAAAVGPLRAVESAAPDDALRRAARKAVLQIQSRLSGASPGQLSLAGAASGQLTLAEDEAGRVALHDADEDPGT